ncbi:MAG TPA: hypothetical protein VEK15_02535, partial [Vicinamibacteria bacterium]|nr:hypothetical protein [Vicinamibacteria bacterium]
MTAKTQSTSRAARSGLPPNTGSGTSPLLPKHLAELFVSPRSFFSGRPALEHSPAVLLVGWFYGMANAIERVAMELLRSELGRPRPAWEILRPFVAEQWAGFWLWVLVSGALGGIFLWWVGGWWYHLRLRWSGARDPDKRLARLTLVYSSFVFAGPAVIAAIIQTLVYSNYATAYAAGEWFSLVLTLFLFWS